MMKIWIPIGLIAALGLLLGLRQQPVALVSQESFPAVTASIRGAPSETALMEEALQPPLPAAMQQAMTQVAAAYQISSQYPPYSIPLDSQQTELLQPNAGAHSVRDLNSVGLPGQLSIQLSAYRYRQDEPIEADITLSGDDALFSQLSGLTLSVRDNSNTVLLMPQAQIQNNRSEQRLHTRFSGRDSWPTELNLVAELQLSDGSTCARVRRFRSLPPSPKSPASARLMSTTTNWSFRSTLTKPPPVTTSSPPACTMPIKSPLAYLQGKGRIGSSGTLELRVHGSLLYNLGGIQNLWIGNLQLRKMPEKPGPEVQWGFSREDFYAVNNVDPSRFSPIPFQDEQTLSRLQFLQSLGSPGTH
ncbi:MAG: hypothetical protein LRY66_17615 [Saccharospirillaceae bacterium]|nr:hypothetical protein [Saccharospirillaceae bacterium]